MISQILESLSDSKGGGGDAFFSLREAKKIRYERKLESYL